jgi:hypothetical protein
LSRPAFRISVRQATNGVTARYPRRDPPPQLSRIKRPRFRAKPTKKLVRRRSTQGDYSHKKLLRGRISCGLYSRLPIHEGTQIHLPSSALCAAAVAVLAAGVGQALWRSFMRASQGAVPRQSFGKKDADGATATSRGAALESTASSAHAQDSWEESECREGICS